MNRLADLIRAIIFLYLAGTILAFIIFCVGCAITGDNIWTDLKICKNDNMKSHIRQFIEDYCGYIPDSIEVDTFHDSLEKELLSAIAKDKPSAGVWIKASEQLPEEKRLVCMRGDGGGCYHHETADRTMLIQRLKDDEGVHHKYDPEWLDDTQN